MFKYLKLTIISLIFLFSPAISKAATEFISVVDTDGTSGDYSTLAAWQLNNHVDLTAATTQVFSGTRTETIADNTTLYLCRSGVYQTHTGRLAHATATQALLDTITGAATEQANDIWYTNDTCDSANYFTISDGGDSAISVASCQATTSVADQTAVTIEGWDTSDTNYIKVYTTQANRHDGKWNTGKYRLEVTITSGNGITIVEQYVRIEGLQIFVEGTVYDRGINGIDITPDTNTSENRVGNCIIRAGNYVKYHGINCGYVSGRTGMTAKIYNNIIYDFDNVSNNGKGITVDDDWAVSAYNNTVHNCYYSYYQKHGSFTTTNCIGNDSVAGDNWNGTITTSYCCSDVAGDLSGTGDRNGANGTVTFENEAGDDFHLGSGDSNAKDNGTSDPGSGLFSDDIDGQTRPSPYWDIGADEYPAKQKAKFKGEFRFKGEIKFK